MNDEQDPVPHHDASSRHLCRTLEGVFGELTLDDDHLRLHLVSFDGPNLFGTPEVFDTVVLMDDGRIATLQNCVRKVVEQRGEVCSMSAAVNAAVLGPTQWESESQVRCIRCEFHGSETALQYTEHIRDATNGIPSGHIPTLLPASVERTKLGILDVEEDSIRVQVGLGISGRFGSFRPELAFTPELIISNSVGWTLPQAIRFTGHILTFFELSTGARSRAKEVRIHHETWATIVAREARFASDDFQLRLFHGDWSPSDEMARPWDTAFPVLKAEQRAQTTEGLRRWIARLSQWEATYALASYYMARRDHFDRDRLLRLTAWFESLPTLDKSDDLQPEHLESIVRAAQHAATSAGLKLDDRIQSLLSNLKQKTLRRQLKEVISDLRTRFGAELVPSTLEEKAMAAAELRAKAAHGAISFNEEDPYTRIAAIRALELVCFLATIRDLLPSGYQQQRITNHPLMAYRRREGARK